MAAGGSVALGYPGELVRCEELGVPVIASADGNPFFGWFDDADQTEPTYDPPHDAPCLFCGDPVRADDVRTHCLMPLNEYAPRSYFYRTHRTCAEKYGSETLDGMMIETIAKLGA